MEFRKKTNEKYEWFFYPSSRMKVKQKANYSRRIQKTKVKISLQKKIRKTLNIKSKKKRYSLQKRK